MRARGLAVGTAVLLCGPTVLAFFAGGYFDGSRAAALTVAWALVLALALAGPSPLPAGLPGRLALGGLAALVAWTAISLAWAPLIGPAVAAGQRLLLYIAALLAAIALLRDRGRARAVEPVLALGALVVIGYGLFERLLPGVARQDGSFAAGGRLEQPITYWNAEGLLAAMALVLCVRLAGDSTRRAPLRALAAAAAPIFGLGVYLSYSRGALAGALIGVILILAVAPTRAQLRSAVVCLASGVIASSFGAALRGVAALEGTLGERERDGAIMLAILVLLAAATGYVMLRAARMERRSAEGALPVPFASRLPVAAGAAVVLCLVGLVIGGLLESSERAGAKASRLTSVSSQRYEYWRVAGHAFVDHPLQGLGAGGYRVYWREHRSVRAGVTEAHSLELEMAAELGIPGLALLAVFLAGVALAVREALRRGAPLAVSGIAVCTVWLLHASIDWDWQLPAVTLPALILAGGLIAESEPPAREPTRTRAERLDEERPLRPTARRRRGALARLALLLR